MGPCLFCLEFADDYSILWAISLGLSSYLMILRVLSRSCVISLSEAKFVQTQDQS